MQYVIDRIEDGIAVLEKDDGSHLELKCDILPENAKEGSVLDFVDGEYIINKKAEDDRRAEILALQKKLFKK